MLVLCRSLGGNLKAQATNGCTPFLLTIAQSKCFIVAPDTYKGFNNETFIIFQGILSDVS